MNGLLETRWRRWSSTFSPFFATITLPTYPIISINSTGMMRINLGSRNGLFGGNEVSERPIASKIIDNDVMSQNMGVDHVLYRSTSTLKSRRIQGINPANTPPEEQGLLSCCSDSARSTSHHRWFLVRWLACNWHSIRFDSIPISHGMHLAIDKSPLASPFSEKFIPSS